MRGPKDKDGNLGSDIKIRIDPVVICSILDHFARRSDEQDNVMGALLGSKVGGLLHVNGCIPIPHVESEDAVTIDIDFQRTMLDLHVKVDLKNTIVGWYSTTYSETSQKAINELYAQRVNPIHILVDPTLKTGSLNIKALCSHTITIKGETIGPIFRELPFIWSTSFAEKLTLDSLMGKMREQGKLDADDGMDEDAQDIGAAAIQSTDSLQSTLKRLHSSLAVIKDYVNKVLSGQVKEDKAIGRQLHSIVTSIPHIDNASFEKVFNNSLQDMLMVIYLAKLIKTELAVTEKIHSVAAPGQDNRFDR